MEQRSFGDGAYERFLEEEKLMGSRCTGCQTLYVPPRPICVNCHDAEMEWVELAGKGKLAAFTCISVGPPSMMAQGYNRKNPYCSGVVALEEGTRVDARIEGVDTRNPETIKVGTPMKVKYLHMGEGVDATTYLAFEPE